MDSKKIDSRPDMYSSAAVYHSRELTAEYGDAWKLAFRALSIGKATSTAKVAKAAGVKSATAEDIMHSMYELGLVGYVECKRGWSFVAMAETI